MKDCRQDLPILTKLNYTTHKIILFAKFYLTNLYTVKICDRYISLEFKYKVALHSDKFKYIN